MKKAASVILLGLLWVLAAGCASQSTPARVHLRVFEVPAQVLQLHTSEQRPYKVPDSAYTLSIVSPFELNAILRSEGPTPRLLTDTTRVINEWPAVTDMWVYSPFYAKGGLEAFYTGGGIGSLGVCDQGGHLEVHLDYLVNHLGPQGQKLVESKIFYERRYPEGQVLLFHAPTDNSGASSRQHVIAFEVTRDDSLSPATPDILAFR